MATSSLQIAIRNATYSLFDECERTLNAEQAIRERFPDADWDDSQNGIIDDWAIQRWGYLLRRSIEELRDAGASEAAGQLSTFVAQLDRTEPDGETEFRLRELCDALRSMRGERMQISSNGRQEIVRDVDSAEKSSSEPSQNQVTPSCATGSLRDSATTNGEETAKSCNTAASAAGEKSFADNSNDLYVNASQLQPPYMEKFENWYRFGKWLKENQSSVPSHSVGRRRKVHAANWMQYWSEKERRASELLDGDRPQSLRSLSEVGSEGLDQIIEQAAKRKAIVDKRCSGKRRKKGAAKHSK